MSLFSLQKKDMTISTNYLAVKKRGQNALCY